MSWRELHPRTFVERILTFDYEPDKDNQRYIPLEYLVEGRACDTSGMSQAGCRDAGISIVSNIRARGSLDRPMKAKLW